MKRLFGLDRTHAQLAIATIGQNFLKAANRITRNPPSHKPHQQNCCARSKGSGTRPMPNADTPQEHQAIAQRSLV